jgi:hypothetical protein
LATNISCFAASYAMALGSGPTAVGPDVDQLLTPTTFGPIDAAIGTVNVHGPDGPAKLPLEVVQQAPGTPAPPKVNPNEEFAPNPVPFTMTVLPREPFAGASETVPGTHDDPSERPRPPGPFRWPAA